MLRSSTKSQIRPLKNPHQFVATSFGASCLPGSMPGTYGTVPAIGLWWVMTTILGWTTGVMVTLTILMFLLGIWLVGRVSLELETHDDPKITWDEIVGYFVAASFAPSGFLWLVLAFGLFRYFDMLKPFPVNLFDLKSGSFWIMADDVVGGVLAGLFLLGFTANWEITLMVLVGHLILVLATRISLRYDRKMCKLSTPSVWEALSGPRSAWK